MPKFRFQVLTCLLLGSAFGSAGVCPSIGVHAQLKDFWTGKPSARDLNNRVDSAISSVTAQIHQITEISGTHTVQNTLRPYDRAAWFLDVASFQTTFLRMTHPDAETRRAATEAEQRLQRLKSSLRLNRAVFLALRALDLSKADAATRWYVEREIRAYKLAGIDRDETTRQTIIQKRDELVHMGQRFQKNIV
jgi:thimet oligopeptidase